MVAAFLVELALFFAFSAIPMSRAEYESIVNSPSYQQISSVRMESLLPRAVAIFKNNYLIASLEIIPVAGPAIFAYTTYSTARVLDALGYGQGVPGPLLVISILLFPHSWLELPAYSIAVTQSVLLIYSAIKKRFVGELVRTIAVWLFVGLELLVAAIVESGIISLELPQDTLLPLVMWFPTLVVMGVGYLLYKRVQRSLRPTQADLVPRIAR